MAASTDDIATALELIDINDYLCWEDLFEDLQDDIPEEFHHELSDRCEQWWEAHSDEIEQQDE